MLKIYKMRADHVVDFAAEELKKYLRMMMPEAGDVEILYSPDAKDGFRLGLLEDFDLPFEGEDAFLDDVVHIETDEKGGILAGSNPRSILFAVYRFLKENGCRWLYPGVDGEFIPFKEICPVSYHKMASMRFRGHCNEGYEYQECMLETIDFYAKQELNVYMLEFQNPYVYYERYYNHKFNEKNRPPEPITEAQALQWKRQCEAEIAKRGLMFHDMGHGWTAYPFGLNTDNRALWTEGVLQVPEETKQYLALRNGERSLYMKDPQLTNLCMSNPEVRSIMAKAVADYAEAHKNVDYLHVWLADGFVNHCECEECQKMRPSDYYLMIMNEIDEELTRRGLETRIVFIAYVDTMFAPEHITIKNPKRFCLMYAPVYRYYTSSISKDTKIPEPDPYLRNKWVRNYSTEANFAHIPGWKKMWQGSYITYEYHFWFHQYNDPGMMNFTRRVYEDIVGLADHGFTGFIEDGSQRSFWPNGFAMHVYAETLLDTSKSIEEMEEDYFSHIYGEDWREAKEYFSKMSAAFDWAYMEGEKSLNKDISKHYNPLVAPKFLAVPEIAAEGRALAKKHLTMPTRPQTISWRLLLLHTEFCKKYAAIMYEKARGFNNTAYDMAQEFYDELGKHEVAIERYFDHAFFCSYLNSILKKRPKFIFEI